MTVDLSQWKANKCREQIDNILGKMDTVYADNDILCSVFKNDWTPIPIKDVLVPRYLRVGHEKLTNGLRISSLSREEYRQWVSKALIIHYNLAGSTVPQREDDNISGKNGPLLTGMFLVKGQPCLTGRAVFTFSSFIWLQKCCLKKFVFN